MGVGSVAWHIHAVLYLPAVYWPTFRTRKCRIQPTSHYIEGVVRGGAPKDWCSTQYPPAPYVNAKTKGEWGKREGNCRGKGCHSALWPRTIGPGYNSRVIRRRRATITTRCPGKNPDTETLEAVTKAIGGVPPTSSMP